MALKKSQLYSSLWQSCDELRGGMDASQYKDYILTLLFKYVSDKYEAVRAGFKKAWQERDYATIITVARKIPENVLQEDPKLLMWYDRALT